MFLLDDLIISPIKGLLWLGEKVKELADAENDDDEGKIREKLMAAQLRFELDEITEEEYTKEEKKLLAQLEEIQKAKDEEENKK